MDVLSQVRADAADAVAAVLPGRVRPYRPDRLAVSSTPLLWIDRLDSARAGYDTVNGIDVTLTIVAVVDGASHAAQAMRDQLHAAVHDAAVAAGFTWLDGTCTSFDVAADVTALALEATILRTVYVTTLCPPEIVTTVPIPPIPVEV